MQTILVPVDFSPESKNAANFAASLAGQLDANLLLFHAYMIPTPISEVPYVMVTADELQKENESLIMLQADQISKDYPIETSWLVRIGIASDEIKALAAEKNIDLVVMGMKGAGGIEKIIGSTTTNVIRKLKTPVLVIPQDSSYKKIEKITYASDFSYATNFHLFNSLLHIAKSFRASITILNVQAPGSNFNADEMTGKKDIENILREHDHKFVSIENASVKQGISHYISENKTDLLVMVAHKHSFFERMFGKHHTSAMAYESHVPLLVLQDKS